jgi:hypothetical protein
MVENLAKYRIKKSLSVNSEGVKGYRKWKTIFSLLKK